MGFGGLGVGCAKGEAFRRCEVWMPPVDFTRGLQMRSWGVPISPPSPRNYGRTHFKVHSGPPPQAHPLERELLRRRGVERDGKGGCPESGVHRYMYYCTRNTRASDSPQLCSKPYRDETPKAQDSKHQTTNARSRSPNPKIPHRTPQHGSGTCDQRHPCLDHKLRK